VAGTTAVGVASTGAGSAAVATTGLAALGPVGWIVLGTEENAKCGETPVPSYTFDCWKPVLHDKSPEPSHGRLLRDVVVDPRVKQAIIKAGDCCAFPEIILQNVWDERFLIDYLMLPSGQVAAHAVCVG
jgi:hypothetical protein